MVSAGGQRIKYGAMWTPGVSITKASEEMPGMELPISLKARTLNLYMMPVHAAVHAVHDAEPVHDAAQDVVQHRPGLRSLRVGHDHPVS